jgi:hypothetical protein
MTTSFTCLSFYRMAGQKARKKAEKDMEQPAERRWAAAN